MTPVFICELGMTWNRWQKSHYKGRCRVKLIVIWNLKDSRYRFSKYLSFCRLVYSLYFRICEAKRLIPTWEVPIFTGDVQFVTLKSCWLLPSGMLLDSFRSIMTSRMMRDDTWKRDATMEMQSRFDYSRMYISDVMRNVQNSYLENL